MNDRDKPRGLLGPLFRFASQLRFPWLFGIVLTAFGIDLVVPDLIPFVDEILLGLTTLFLGAWRKRKDDRSVDEQDLIDQQPPT